MLRPWHADLPRQTIEGQADFSRARLAGPVPDVRWGFAVGAAEDAVEIGTVAEDGLVRSAAVWPDPESL